MNRLLVRFLRESNGQDLIEYALLTSLIGIVGIFIWQNIGVGVFNAYTGWDTGVQGLSVCTPDPIAHGGGGC